MFDVQAITADLEALVRARASLPIAIERAPLGVRQLARYRGPLGPQTLADDIRAAVQSLPESRTYPGSLSGDRPIRADAEKLLFAEPRHTWTKRTGDFAGMLGADDASRRWYARCLLFEVAGLLADRHVQGLEPFQWLSYTWHLEMDPNDAREHTDTREVQLRTLLPRQEVVSIRHFYDGDPESPAVEAASPNHTYIGRVPSPDGGRWWDNFIRIDRSYEVGEEFTLRVVARYRDEALAPHRAGELSYIVRTGLERLELAVRLPPAIAARAKAEWQINTNPFVRPVRLASGAVTPTDGWHRHVFESPESHTEHRLALGIDPYRAP